MIDGGRASTDAGRGGRRDAMNWMADERAGWIGFGQPNAGQQIAAIVGRIVFSWWVEITLSGVVAWTPCALAVASRDHAAGRAVAAGPSGAGSTVGP
jgi:hypothetical protein